MGKMIYWITILLYKFGVWAAKGFNEKAMKMWEGRQQVWKHIQENTRGWEGPVIWVHCASLGEFEQGRPVIEKIKEQCSDIKILITFFSPSGYEVRKNYANADAVFYLPFDSAKNARQFISLVKPSLVFFVKYEFWHYYLKELKKRNIPVLSVSAIFRPGQLFFKSYGGFYRNILTRFDHIFVQNEVSKNLLNSIGLENVDISGDTRFDRVYQITRNPAKIPIAEKFKGHGKVFVIGSSWPNDIEVVFPFVNRWRGRLKFIIAPHELAEKNLVQIERLINGKVVRFSKTDISSEDEYDVLLIDNIGMLSSLYSYGEYAYVGGSFDSGLHNTLEAAAYGIPVFFGRGEKNVKYQEAVDLIANGAAFEISSAEELENKMNDLYGNTGYWQETASAAKKYILDNLGATDKIVSYTHKYLKDL